MAKISVVIPFHWMQNWEILLTRCLMSIEQQSFKDYEVILTKAGTMPVNSNRAIESAQGDLIKVLYMDDYLAHAFSLQEIVDNFTDEVDWLVTGCLHDENGEIGNPHRPIYTTDIETGNNQIGSPSVLTMRRGKHLLFDEKLSWLLDCDLYKRLYENYGAPKVVDAPNVIIGLHGGQTSNLMSDADKTKEHKYLKQKYA